MSQALRKVPFARPSLGAEEAEAAAATVASGWVVGGPRLLELETAFAQLCGTKTAVGVSSWTTGAFLVLKTLGIGPGDEVIVPSLTFIASVNAIVHAGATPVFADINPSTFNIDPDHVGALITSRTRAILPVDQLGLPCDIDRVVALAECHGLLVIQDAACSVGSRFHGKAVGSQAPITIFSLHARKVVTTGEGGMIVTDDEDLAARLRRQRHQGMSLSDFERHGASPTLFETYPQIGYNFRLTDIQAAIGIVQMRKIEDLIARRRSVADRYTQALANSPHLMPPHVPSHVTPNWQSYQVRLTDGAPLNRNQLMERLHARGIATRRGVMASHLEAPYRATKCVLPHTEATAATTLQLPMFADMTPDDVGAVIAALAAEGLLPS